MITPYGITLLLLHLGDPRLLTLRLHVNLGDVSTAVKDIDEFFKASFYFCTFWTFNDFWLMWNEVNYYLYAEYKATNPIMMWERFSTNEFSSIIKQVS